MIKKSFISFFVISTIFIFFSCGKAHEHEYVYFSDANNHWQMCCGCGEKLDKEKHTWDDGVVTKEATEEEEGIKTFTCTVCDYESNESIDKVENKTSTEESTSNPTEASDGKDGKDGTDGENGSDGKNGKDGKDGLSINWLGSYDAASKITSPKKLDAYYNTTNGCSYIYDGTQWTLLASKGENGTPGGDGSDGVSITWRGSFASSSEVANPVKLNAYYNTTDGCSYIYNGTQWTLLASKGENGTPGGNGTNGVSITWRGSFTSAAAITEPSTLDAYYNTTDGCSYIYDGNTWTLLASKGAQGPAGNDSGLQVYSITYELDGGTLGSDNPANYIGGINTPLGKATKEGYSFVGWYTDSSLKGRPITFLGANTSENITVYARWFKGIITTVAEFDKVLESSNSSTKIMILDEYPYIESIKAAMLSYDTVMVDLDLSLCAITSIKVKAFYTVKNLNTITLPDTITSIEDWSFGECSNITSIILPDSVISIGNYVFSGCTNLNSISLGSSLTTIEDYCFSSCTNLSSIIIPDSVTSIGLGVFYECKNITSITLSSSLNSISDREFYNCRELQNLIIPSKVTSIGDCAFESCISLTNMTISDSVTSIGSYAFRECTSLISLMIPVSVKTIKGGLLYGCTNFNTIYYKGSETQWNKINIVSPNNPVISATKIYNYESN